MTLKLMILSRISKARLDASRTPLLQDEERSDLLPESFAKRLAARVLNPAWAAEMPPGREPDESRMLAAPEEEQGLVAITPSPEQQSEFSKESTLIADPDLEILERYCAFKRSTKRTWIHFQALFVSYIGTIGNKKQCLTAGLFCFAFSFFSPPKKFFQKFSL